MPAARPAATGRRSSTWRWVNRVSRSLVRRQRERLKNNWRRAPRSRLVSSSFRLPVGPLANCGKRAQLRTRQRCWQRSNLLEYFSHLHRGRRSKPMSVVNISSRRGVAELRCRIGSNLPPDRNGRFRRAEVQKSLRNVPRRGGPNDPFNRATAGVRCPQPRRRPMPIARSIASAPPPWTASVSAMAAQGR